MITYLPRETISKKLKKRDIKKLIGNDLSLNKEVLNTLANSGIVSKKSLSELALKTIKSYKKRAKEEEELGATKREALKISLNDKAQIINRVENAAAYEISQAISQKYNGEFYEWLPSDSDEPDPEHQLNYGKVFQVGVGEMPGDRYGCKCGMNILVDDTRLNL